MNIDKTKEMKNLKIQKVQWLMLLVILMWGTNFVVYKLLIESFPFWVLMFFRNFFATITLFWLTRKLLKVRIKGYMAWIFIVLATFTGIFFNNVLFQMGIRDTLATNVSLIMALTPITTTFISFLVFREPLHGKQVLGIFFAFFGVVLVVLKGSLRNLIEFSVNIGDLFIVCSLLSFSISFIFIKKAVDHKVPSELMTAYGHAISLIFIIPFLFMEQSTSGWSSIPSTPIYWLLLIFMGIFPTALGNMLWNRGIAELGPSKATIFMNGTPLVTAIASFFVLGEVINGIQILGFFIIATGVILGSQSPKHSTNKKIDKDQSSMTV